MKKLLLLFAMTLFGSSVFSQSKLSRDIMEAKQILKVNGYSIQGISNDSIITVADSLLLTTQYAMKKYVDANAGTVDTVAEIATKYDLTQIKYYINVAQFGALGDGTDQTIAIQSALDSAGSVGGVVWFPKGIYMTDELFVLANTKILGENHNSILMLNPSLPGDKSVLSINKGGAKHHENITIENITIDGNRDSYTSGLSTENELIDADNTKNLRIINCQLRNGIADAIDLDGENVNLLVYGNYINNIDKMGMHMYGIKNGSITNNIIDSIGINLADGIKQYNKQFSRRDKCSWYN